MPRPLGCGGRPRNAGCPGGGGGGGGPCLCMCGGGPLMCMGGGGGGGGPGGPRFIPLGPPRPRRPRMSGYGHVRPMPLLMGPNPFVNPSRPLPLIGPGGNPFIIIIIPRPPRNPRNIRPPLPRIFPPRPLSLLSAEGSSREGVSVASITSVVSCTCSVSASIW